MHHVAAKELAMLPRVLVGVALTFALIAVDGIAAQAKKDPAKEDVIKISSEKLAEECAKDEEAAQKKYRGRMEARSWLWAATRRLGERDRRLSSGGRCLAPIKVVATCS
jgi:hypothetical protein